MITWTRRVLRDVRISTRHGPHGKLPAGQSWPRRLNKQYLAIARAGLFAELDADVPAVAVELRRVVWPLLPLSCGSASWSCG